MITIYISVPLGNAFDDGESRKRSSVSGLPSDTSFTLSKRKLKISFVSIIWGRLQLSEEYWRLNSVDVTKSFSKNYYTNIIIRRNWSLGHTDQYHTSGT